MKLKLVSTIRAHFERKLIPDDCHGCIALEITTIAPTPRDGKTLAEMGWSWIARNAGGEIVAVSNPDEKRREILRGFGHNV